MEENLSRAPIVSIDFFAENPTKDAIEWVRKHQIQTIALPPTSGLILTWHNNGPAILDIDTNSYFYYEFDNASFWRRIRSSLNETDLLIRAIGAKKNKPTVFDATFGLGRDAFQLASWGCNVISSERNKTLYCLAEFYLNKLDLEKPNLIFGAAENINLPIQPDVIYFDPMFHEEKSSLSQKSMQTLKKLLANEHQNEKEALKILSTKFPNARLVVKRTLKMQKLEANTSLHHFNSSVLGKAIRFDIYLSK